MCFSKRPKKASSLIRLCWAVMTIMLLCNQGFAQQVNQQTTSLQQNTQAYGFRQNVGQLINQHGKANSLVNFAYNTTEGQFTLRRFGHAWELRSEHEGSRYFNRVDVEYLVHGQQVELRYKGSAALTDEHKRYYSGEANGNTPAAFAQVDASWLNGSAQYNLKADGSIKYDLFFPSQTALQAFSMRYSGATSVKANGDSLIIQTPHHKLVEHIPAAYFVLPDGSFQETDIHYTVIGKQVQFVAKQWPASATLVIDPDFFHTVKYGTYFGGKDEDESYSVVTDTANNVYITGKTNSTANVASSGAYQDTLGGSTDAFIAKFDDELGTLEWATYFGGADEDIGNDIALDENAHVYIVGVTRSDSVMATSGTFQRTLGGTNSRDAFVAKFTTKGKFVWGTYYGGSGEDYGHSISVEDNRLAICGATKSTNGTTIATNNSHQSTHGGSTGYNDGFVAMLDTAGKRQWGTYYGGDEEDVAYAIALDANKNIYAAGYTESDNNTIATSNTHQTSLGGRFDAFLVKFNNSGTRQWGTYFGGSRDDLARGVALLNNGSRIFISGETESRSDIATNGAYQGTKGTGSDPDAFLAAFNPNNGNNIWGTYLGGSGEDIGYDVCTDIDNHVILTGRTKSGTGMSVTGAYQTSHAGTGYFDAFLAKFSSSGAGIWSTYFGSTLEDIAFAITSDRSAYMVMTGLTRGTSGIATSGAFSTSQSGGNDVFVVKWCDIIITQHPQSKTVWTGNSAQFSAQHIGTRAGNFTYQWYLDSVAISGANARTYTIAAADTGDIGKYYVEIGNDCGKIGSNEAELKLNNATRNQSICIGSSVNLQVAAISGATYSWSPSTGLSSTTGNQVTASPTQTTQYQVVVNNGGTRDTVKIEVEVKPLPVFSAGPDSLICSGEEIFIGDSLRCKGCQYQWMPNNTIYLASDTAAYTRYQRVNNSGNRVSNTYWFTATQNGCSKTDTLTLTVEPEPFVFAGNDTLSCANNPPFNLNGFSPSGGYWVGKGLTDSVKGTINPAIADTGTHTYYYHIVNQQTGCPNEDSLQLTVNLPPVVSVGNDTTICDAFTSLSLSGAPTGGNWSGHANLSSNGTFNAQLAGVGQYETYYTYQDPNTKCQNVDTLNITVTRPQVANAGNDTSLCQNTTSFKLNPSPSGGSWTSNAIRNDSFLVQLADTGLNKLVYRFSAGACASYDTLEVTVLHTPQVNAGLDTAYCEAIDTFQLPSASPIGGYWRGTGIIDSVNGHILTSGISYNNSPIYYFYTSPTTKCATIDTLNIRKNALPSLNLRDTTLCDQADSVRLAAQPAGGVWSGYALQNDGDFNAKQAGIGTYTATYVYDDGNGCAATDSLKVQVQKTVFANAGQADTLCFDDAPVTLSGQPSSGIWTGKGVTNGAFNPVAAGPGTFYLKYTYGMGSCLTSDSVLYTVEAPLKLQVPKAISTCQNDTIIALKSRVAYPGWFAGSNVSDSINGTFDPANVAMGQYPVAFKTIDTTTGCLNTDTITINVNAVPNISISLDSILCNNVVDTFKVNTGDSAVWDFGNGNILNGKTVTHWYTGTPGTFTIQLLAFSGSGCTDTLEQEIETLDPPKAGFTVDTNQGCGPLSIYIENTGSGKYTNYQWALGDGTQSNNDSIGWHTYNARPNNATTRYIQQFAQNQCYTDTFIDSIVILPPPRAFVYSEPSTGCTPFEVSIRNRSIGSPDSLYWYYGDGTSGYSLDSIQEHTYYTDSIAKEFTISLIIANDCGIDSGTTTITVKPKSVEGYFDASEHEGCAPLSIEAVDHHIGGATRAWWVSDGSTYGNVDTIQHTFQQAGNYTITQVVDDGCSQDTFTSAFTVYGVGNLNFGANKKAYCAFDSIFIENQSSATLAEITWETLGQSGNGQRFSFIADSAGEISVTMVVKSADANQCVDTLTKSITVHSGPDINLQPDTTVGCIPFQLNVDNSTTNAIGHLWKYQENEARTTQKVGQYTFQNAGRYSVSYVATTIEGCKDSTSFTVLTNPIPTADFTISDSAACNESMQVMFTNTSVPEPLASYWLVQNDTLVQKDYTLNVQELGSYPVRLEVTNEFGCTDRKSYTFTNFEKPEAIMDTSINACDRSVVFASNSIQAQNIIWHIDGKRSALNADEVFTHHYADTTESMVKLIAIHQNGCKDSVEALIDIPSDHRYVYIPNAFTPNGDGLNDVFKMHGYNHRCYGEATLKIYNRWGERVYSETNLDPTWDGSFNELGNTENGFKSQPYVYVFTTQTRTFSGNVTLLK